MAIMKAVVMAILLACAGPRLRGCLHALVAREREASLAGARGAHRRPRPPPHPPPPSHQAASASASASCQASLAWLPRCEAATVRRRAASVRMERALTLLEVTLVGDGVGELGLDLDKLGVLVVRVGGEGLSGKLVDDWRVESATFPRVSLAFAGSRVIAEVGLGSAAGRQRPAVAATAAARHHHWGQRSRASGLGRTLCAAGGLPGACAERRLSGPERARAGGRGRGVTHTS